MELNFSLHPAQLKIFSSPARFRVVAAGRRFGKSYLAAVELLCAGIQSTGVNGEDLSLEEVYYVAPTFEQAKRIMWHVLKDLGQNVIKSVHENTGTITLTNNRRISLKGSDRPDTLRGVGLSFVVMDEFAFMKPEVWEKIIRPALIKSKGRALFIGTPEGKNHFYDLYLEAHQTQGEYQAFSFTSKANPFLPKEEIDTMAKNMSSAIYRQEIEASFIASGGLVFKEEWFLKGPEPEDAYWHIAVDPAGFVDAESGATSAILRRRDECAIAIAKVGPDGWYVADIDTGQWGVRETALRILKHATDYRPMSIGIEKGSLKNAIMPYLLDEMKRLNTFFVIEELTHGGNKKQERIAWALQGRLEKGRMTFKEGAYLPKLIEQACDFPNPLARDDMLDSLSYIDQLASANYSHFVNTDDWQPLDLIAGF